MAKLDGRRPAEVTAEFRERLGRALAPHGFASRSKGSAFVRRQRRVTDRVELSSSHHNAPGSVACFASWLVVDADVVAIAPRWRAGGGLDDLDFGVDPPGNLADSREAEAALLQIVAGLDFFAFADDARLVLGEVGRRYVPGFVEPRVVVPYLRARLGVAAVEEYATALLLGRPELWPAFESARRAPAPPSGPEPSGGSRLDHGTSLALELARHGAEVPTVAPAGTVPSLDVAARNLRCFFGRQLRAWGEAELAPRLLSVSDTEVRAIRATQERVGGPVIDEGPVLAVLRALGVERRPRRAAPEPRLFQYHARHGPFGRPPRRP